MDGMAFIGSKEQKRNANGHPRCSQLHRWAAEGRARGRITGPGGRREGGRWGTPPCGTAGGGGGGCLCSPCEIDRRGGGGSVWWMLVCRAIGGFVVCIRNTATRQTRMQKHWPKSGSGMYRVRGQAVLVFSRHGGGKHGAVIQIDE